MELAQLQDAFRFKGLNVQGTMAYGEVNGYPFNIMAMGKGTEIYSLRASFALEKPVRNRLLKPVKSELATIGTVVFAKQFVPPVPFATVSLYCTRYPESTSLILPYLSSTFA